MKIVLAGIGMGSPGAISVDVHDALSGAEVHIGAARLLAGLGGRYPGQTFAEAVPEKVAALIATNPQWQSVCVVLSGDSGFYSGAKSLVDLLAHHNPLVLPGISAPSYFAARLGRPWQSWRLVSAHGIACDIIAEVVNHAETFFLTGASASAVSIVETLCANGLCEAVVTVGENLSSPDERIVSGSAASLAGQAFDPLSVVLVENATAFSLPSGAAGLPDELFIRGAAPMTKQEVRAVALALLRPGPEAVAYDIGAGTGSVAVELALQARRGRVYAVEMKADAVALIHRNKQKFGTANLAVIHGRAPEALANLPAPDVCFIGGSGKMMQPVIDAVLAKNPAVRLVASAIALESLGHALDALTQAGRTDVQVRQIAVSRTIKRGEYTMLSAANPVFLISAGEFCG